MNRVTTFGALQQVSGAGFLNPFQDQAGSCAYANKNNDLSAGSQACEGRVWFPTGGLANATLVQLDSSIDWRDRMIWVWYRDLSVTTKRPGQLLDYQFDLGTATAQAPIHGYTGKGGYSNVNTLAAVASGSPPVIGTGGGANPSYALILAGAGASYATGGAPTTTTASLFLIVDGAGGNANSLSLYNNTGVALVNPWLTVFASGKTGKRP